MLPFCSGFLQPEKIATKVKMRQQWKCIRWSEVFFLNSPLSCRPLWGPLAVSLFFPWGNAPERARLANAWQYEGWTGKSTTQSTLAVKGKGHWHLSLKRSWNRDSHVESIWEEGRKRWDFHLNGNKHLAVHSVSDSTRKHIIMSSSFNAKPSNASCFFFFVQIQVIANKVASIKYNVLKAQCSAVLPFPIIFTLCWISLICHEQKMLRRILKCN